MILDFPKILYYYYTIDLNLCHDFHYHLGDNFMSHFYEVETSLENYWRSIILFGNNVASYKFALAKALYDLKTSSNDLITLEQLASPFSKNISSL